MTLGRHEPSPVAGHRDFVKSAAMLFGRVAHCQRMHRGTPHVVCDTAGRPITPAQAKTIIAKHWTVPPEIRARRRWSMMWSAAFGSGDRRVGWSAGCSHVFTVDRLRGGLFEQASHRRGIAYVANYYSGTVTPIRTTINTTENPIKVGRGPGPIAITP